MNTQSLKESLNGDDSLFSNVRNGDVRALLADLERAEKALAAIAQQAQEPWGWAIEDKHGVAQAIRPSRKEFFGCIQATEPFTVEDVEKMGREWSGLAPHRIVKLYTTPPAPQPAPVDELPDLNPEDIVVDVVLKQLGGFAPITTHGIRVTHKPSLISVVVDSERSQHRNRQLALEALRAITHHRAHPEPVGELIEALEDLMDWQVKNVALWHNRAYDRAHQAIKKHRAGGER